MRTGSSPTCSRSAGRFSDNKGVNVPDVVVPIPALTEKDRSDLAFALEQEADWIALSFVQRPEDVAEARALIGDKAALMAKIEKPAAIDRLEEIIDACRRGDGGARRPWGRASARSGAAAPEPHRRLARQAGKPVVVATQMLELMIVIADPDPGRGQRRRQRHLRRRRRGHAVGGKRGRQISARGGGDDGPDRAAASKPIRCSGRGSISPRPARADHRRRAGESGAQIAGRSRPRR